MNEFEEDTTGWVAEIVPAVCGAVYLRVTTPDGAVSDFWYEKEANAREYAASAGITIIERTRC